MSPLPGSISRPTAGARTTVYCCRRVMEIGDRLAVRDRTVAVDYVAEPYMARGRADGGVDVVFRWREVA